VKWSFKPYSVTDISFFSDELMMANSLKRPTEREFVLKYSTITETNFEKKGTQQKLKTPVLSMKVKQEKSVNWLFLKKPI